MIYYIYHTIWFIAGCYFFWRFVDKTCGSADIPIILFVALVLGFFWPVIIPCYLFYKLFKSIYDHKMRHLDKKAKEELYFRILNRARSIMESSEIEPKSALKQAAADFGIEYGEEMRQFVEWADKKLK